MLSSKTYFNSCTIKSFYHGDIEIKQIDVKKDFLHSDLDG